MPTWLNTSALWEDGEEKNKIFDVFSFAQVFITQGAHVLKHYWYLGNIISVYMLNFQKLKISWKYLRNKT